MFESRAEQGLSIDHVNLKEKERFMKGEKVSCVRAKETPNHLPGSERTARGRKGRVPLRAAALPAWRQQGPAAFCLTEGGWKVTRSPGPLRGLGLPLCFGQFLEALWQMAGSLTLLSHWLSLSFSL